MLRWLVTSERELDRAGIDEDPGRILSTSELEIYAGYTVPKRRRDWLLGRWTAKRVLHHVVRARLGIDIPLSELSIRRADTGVPQPDLPPMPAIGPMSLSISHSGGQAAAAITTAPGAVVGIDLEPVVPRHPRLPEDYFTDAEQQFVRKALGPLCDRAVTSVWCAKEAVLKVLGVGLSVTTRSLECLPAELEAGHPRWRPCSVELLKIADHARKVSGIQARWSVRDGYLLAIACGRDEA